MICNGLHTVTNRLDLLSKQEETNNNWLRRFISGANWIEKLNMTVNVFRVLQSNSLQQFALFDVSFYRQYCNMFLTMGVEGQCQN